MVLQSKIRDFWASPSAGKKKPKDELPNESMVRKIEKRLE
jgi:hypothetical protein